MAIPVLVEFFSRPWTKIISSYLLVLLIGIGLGVWGTNKWQEPPAPEIRVVENVKYVDVPVEKIVTKTVTKYVRDTKEVSRLLNEAAAAELRIATLTETIASLKTTTVAPPETKTVFVEKPGAPEAHFKDWRLTFDATSTQTTYQLDQKFEAIAAIGKDKEGKPTVKTRLFEIGPGETRTEMTDASTIVVSATPNQKHWFFTGAIQAGFGYTRDIDAGKGVSGGLVGLQWIKKGTSKAAEDSSLSLLTPVAYISSDTVEFGVLPVSLNLGKIPKQPFRDLWVSPLLVFGKAPNVSPTRLGVSLTATF